MSAKRYVQEITPGDRMPRDPVIVTIPDGLLARVERRMQEPGDAPVWALGAFEDTARPRIVIYAVGRDPTDHAPVQINLRRANCYAEDGTRLSRVTRRPKDRKVHYTFTWRPEA